LPDGSGHMQPFLDQALADTASVPGSKVEWLSELRGRGASLYGDRGLPGRRDEYWRYTNLNELGKHEYQLANGAPSVEVPPLPHRAVAELASYRIVFVNGRLRPDLCVLDDMPDGVLIAGLGDMIAAAPDRLQPFLGQNLDLHDMPLAALNTAFMRDGMVLFVDAGVDVDKPVHLVSITVPGQTPLMLQPRHLVVLGDGAKATLIESHIGGSEGAYFNNLVSELTLGEGAELNHYTFQEEGPAAVHIAATALNLAASATYDGFLLQSGGLIGRVETRAILNGSDADCRLDGIYLGTDSQVLDTTTYVEHVAAGCRSRQVYKGVLDGKARGVFQGKIHVKPGAQQTDGHQLSRALLLSPRAEIDTRPELEIYADDVKCSHGATAGELDAEALFYLMSRGIAPAAARRILIEAFVSEALSEIRLSQVAEDFSAHVRNWLNANINVLTAD
jgi:Fe-S cluster assembly protein SufD